MPMGNTATFEHCASPAEKMTWRAPSVKACRQDRLAQGDLADRAVEGRRGGRRSGAPLPRFLRRLDRDRQHAPGLLPCGVLVLCLARAAWHRRTRRYRAVPRRRLSEGAEGIGRRRAMSEL